MSNQRKTLVFAEQSHVNKILSDRDNEKTQPETGWVCISDTKR